MPNLDINIVAKSNLKSELLVAQQALKQLGQQATAAARDVAKGIGDPARVQQLTRAWEEQNAVVRRLSGEYRNLSGSVDETAQSFRSMVREGRGMRRLAGELTSFGGGISGLTTLLGGLAGGFVGAFAGQAVGNAISFMLKSLGSMAEALSKLQNQALQSGLPPIVMQAIGEAAKRAGLDAEVGTKSLETFSKALDALRAKPDPGIKIVNGMAMVIPQFEKGAEVTKDWSNSLEALGKNFRRFPDTPQGKIDAYRAAIQKALELEAQFPSQINRLSQELFGAPIAMIRAMSGDVQNLDALINKLLQTDRGATNARLQALGELKTAQGQLGTAWQEMNARYETWLFGQQAGANRWLALFIAQNSTIEGLQANFARNTQATLDTLLASWNSFSASLQALVQGLLDSMTQAWTSFWSSVQSLGQSTLDWIGNQISAIMGLINQAVSAIQSAIGLKATAGAPVAPGGFAAGGVVRGRGTGTSDSILARLSNGEFVMRAAAVQHWGAGMLSAMNSAGTPRFAEGGLVAAGGGTGRAVHLHLGGSEFALSGASNVVDALVTEASRQRMRSGGLKPSWYGGRVSG